MLQLYAPTLGKQMFKIEEQCFIERVLRTIPQTNTYGSSVTIPSHQILIWAVQVFLINIFFFNLVGIDLPCR